MFPPPIVELSSLAAEDSFATPVPKPLPLWFASLSPAWWPLAWSDPRNAFGTEGGAKGGGAGGSVMRNPRFPFSGTPLSS